MDFNPSFSFDLGPALDAPQAPWEFKGALEQASAGRGTDIDFKIQKHRTQSKRNYPQSRTVDVSDSGSEEEELLVQPQKQKGQNRKNPVVSYEEDEVSVEEVDDDSEDSEQEVEMDSSDAEDKMEHGETSEEESELEEEEEEEEIEEASEQEYSEEEEGKDSDEEVEPKGGKRSRPGGQFPENGGTVKRSKKSGFEGAPKETSFNAGSFSDLNLSRPLIRACAALGYSRPTPIQAACIPLALTGRDICGSAITGSGKTAAFSLPLLERLLHRNRRVATTYVLVLAPARELAVQVHSMIQKLAQYTDIQAALVIGGLSLQSQAAALRAGPEIVVATPGRLIDHLHNSQGFGLEDLATLVLDEADRLLEMGFAEEIKEIVRLSPSRRQTLLFSATMSDEVKDLVALSLRHPVRLAADAASASPSTLRQEVIRFKGSAAYKKEATLLTLTSRSLASTGRCIVFFSTKQRAHRAKILFGLAGLPLAAELHGDMTQAARLEGLERFRKGEVAFLLATDVAARGLDILGVETVINYDCPRNLASYLHRVGRTARAGLKGLAITFAEDSDRALLKEVVKKGAVDLGQRVVPAPAVASWHNKIEGMEGQVGRILGEEREEKELRKAEMEAQKAANMIEHETEIYSRPPRTWFQSEKEKKDVAAAAKDAAFNHQPGELDASVQKKIDKNTAKSARRMDRKIATGKEEAEKARNGNSLMDQTLDTTRRVKAVKAREAALRQEGMPASKAGRIAAAMVSGVKKAKKGKKAAGDLFSGDGVNEKSKTSSSGPARVYAGGARSGKPRAPEKMDGKALKRMQRGGKSKSSFKSKARHKRR